MQFSFAVRSNKTVAAGYFSVIKSLLGYKNSSSNSTILGRYFYKTEIPS